MCEGVKVGAFADIVVFDPATIQDHGTYDKPHQLSTGVSDVIVNGQFALEDGKATGASTGSGALTAKSIIGMPIREIPYAPSRYPRPYLPPASLLF